MKKTIYNLKIHEELHIEDRRCFVMRVASGWIYRYYTSEKIGNSGYALTFYQSVFVPYVKERTEDEENKG